MNFIIGMIAGAVAGYFGGLHAVGWFVLGEIIMAINLLSRL